MLSEMGIPSNPSDLGPAIGKNKLVHSMNFSETGPVDGLIGYWPMNGNLLDYSLNNNDGTASDATVVGGFAPRDRYCYEFLGAADTVDLDTSNPIPCNDSAVWSWSAWIYKASYATHGIAGHHLDFSGDPAGRISFYNGTADMGIYTTTNNDTTIEISPVWPTSTWFHWCVTHTDANLFTFYNDGVSAGSTTVNGDIDVTRIGDNPSNSGWISLTGHMFDFRIYNKVLTTQEINILSSMFDINGSNPSELKWTPEMKLGSQDWYTLGEFKEQL